MENLEKERNLLKGPKETEMEIHLAAGQKQSTHSEVQWDSIIQHIVIF